MEEPSKHSPLFGGYRVDHAVCNPVDLHGWDVIAEELVVSHHNALAIHHIPSLSSINVLEPFSSICHSSFNLVNRRHSHSRFKIRQELAGFRHSSSQENNALRHSSEGNLSTVHPRTCSPGTYSSHPGRSHIERRGGRRNRGEGQETKSRARFFIWLPCRGPLTSSGGLAATKRLSGVLLCQNADPRRTMSCNS